MPPGSNDNDSDAGNLGDGRLDTESRARPTENDFPTHLSENIDGSEKTYFPPPPRPAPPEKNDRPGNTSESE